MRLSGFGAIQCIFFARRAHGGGGGLDGGNPTEWKEHI